MVECKLSIEVLLPAKVDMGDGRGAVWRWCWKKGLLVGGSAFFFFFFFSSIFLFKVDFLPRVEPTAGLELVTLRLRPELGSRVLVLNPLSYPGALGVSAFKLTLENSKWLQVQD